MLPPQAPPSPRGARRPHHRHRSSVSSPTIGLPVLPSPGPIPASASTTPPRSTAAPFQFQISPTSPTPHQRSPTPTAIIVVSQPPMSPLPVRPPNRLSLGSDKDTGPTFPGSPSSVGQNRPASRRLRLPLLSPWAERGEWAEPIGRARPGQARPGQVHLWAKSNATVPICIFHSNYSNSILIKVQTSKIVGNCMKSIKL
jgi:hypothetical protein